MNADAKVLSKAQVAIFRASEAPDLGGETMPLGRMRPADERGRIAALEVGMADSAVIRLLFKDDDRGVSLTYAWFKKHATLPRHSHSADCLYYVVSGSLKFGSEELSAGDSFLVPADTLYSYEVGPDGLEVLEFRTATEFDISFSGTDASWAKLIDNLKVQQAAWASLVPPLAARKMMSRATD